MTPFDDTRVGIIVSDWSLTIPWANVPTWATDVFLPGHDPKTTPAVYDKAALDGRQRGTKVQLWYDGTHGQSGLQLAVAVDDMLRAIPQHGGGVEVNIENGSDGALATIIGDWYVEQRHRRPTRALALNLAPFKGFVLTAAMAADPFFHVRVQNFYGNEMRQADMDEARRDVTGRFPEARFSFCYSSKAHTYSDGHIECDLPVFADGGVYVRRLRKGSIFNLNLMKEAALV